MQNATFKGIFWSKDQFFISIWEFFLRTVKRLLRRDLCHDFDLYLRSIHYFFHGKIFKIVEDTASSVVQLRLNMVTRLPRFQLCFLSKIDKLTPITFSMNVTVVCTKSVQNYRREHF